MNDRVKKIRNLLRSLIKKFITVILLGVTLVFVESAWSTGKTLTPAPVEPKYSTGRYDISGNIAFFEDKTGTMSLEEIIKKQNQFKMLNNRYPSFGITQSSVWGKFTILNSSEPSKVWHLMFNYPIYEKLNVFVSYDNGKKFKEFNLGTRLIDSRKENIIWKPNISVFLKQNRSVLVYFQASNPASSLETQLILLTPHDLRLEDRKNTMIEGFFMGSLLIIFLSNLFIFIVIRYKSYFYYTLNVLFSGLSILFIAGHVMNDFFENYYYAYSIASNITFGLAPICAILFGNNFLQTRNNVPWVYYILLIHVGQFIFFIPFSVIEPTLASELYNISMLSCTIFLILAAFKLARKFVYARIYIVAWLLFLISLVLTMLRNFHIIFLPVTYQAIEIGLIIDQTLLSFALAYRIRSLQRLADYDVLTGVKNRSSFQRYILQTISNSGKSAAHSWNMILIDIDNFKYVNDTYGHEAGDDVLRAAAATLSNSIRSEDFLARWGGEEFVILHKGKPTDSLIIAEKLRLIIKANPIPPVGIITISAGVSTYNGSESIRDFFKKADTALYKAKTSGKDRVIMHDNATDG